MPDAIHCDHGSIFVCDYFYALLRDLGIDLLLSRGKKPTDNPQVERCRNPAARCPTNPGIQGPKRRRARAPGQRGAVVDRSPTSGAPATVRRAGLPPQLAHRAGAAQGPHGARPPGDVGCHGRGDRSHRRPLADLIYQFLPVRWGTVGHAGVEFRDMTYDSPILDAYRGVPTGYFRTADRAAPFYVDPHDLSRIWFRDPQSNRVEPIEWRGAPACGTDDGDDRRRCASPDP